MRKRLLSLVLIVAMLVSTAPVAFATEGNPAPEETTLNYVSLGDSMTNGYGLPGYDGNTGCYDYGDGSYANLFAQWLEKEGYADKVNHSQLAMSAMRAEDLHWLLELDYTDQEAIALTDMPEWDEAAWNAKFTTGDYWTWNELCDDYRFAVSAYTIEDAKNHEGEEDYEPFADDGSKIRDREAVIVAKTYQDAVANADIISLGMGNGNFGVFMFGRMMEAIGFGGGEPGDAMIYNVERAIAECDPEIQAYIGELKAELYSAVEAYLGMPIDDGDDSTTTTLEAIANTVIYTGISYVLNYAGSVEAILKLNPDAEIILVALMNTFADDNGSSEGVTIGDLLEIVYTPLNAYIAALPTVMQAAGNGAYADATFYYAEAADVECMVEVYGDDFDNPTSVTRDRFITDIVGEPNEPGMVWGLMGPMVGGIVEGASLESITLRDVIAYDTMDPVQKASCAANPQTRNWAISCALYLAFEDAIVEACKGAPVSLESVLGLGALDASLFGGVIESFRANIGTAGLLYLDTAAAIVAAGSDGMLTGDQVKALCAAEDRDAAIMQLACELAALKIKAEGLLQLPVEITPALIQNMYGTGNSEIDSAVDAAKDLLNGAVGSVEMICMLLAVPETLSASLQEDPAVFGLLSLFGRCVIGNGLGSHPSATGHNALFEAVRDAYDNGYTAKDETIKNAEKAAKIAADLIAEYYDEAYAYAYAEAKKAGYIDAAKTAINEAIAELNAIDLSECEMTDDFEAEVKVEIAKIIEALEAAKDLLDEADVLDQASLDALMDLLNEAGDAAAHLEHLLAQAGEDVTNLIVIPAINDAVEKLETEVIPAAKTLAEKIVKEAAAQLKEMLGDAYDAAVECLADLLTEYGPKAVQAAYDWLYNNPDKVVAFIQEYADDAGDFLVKYHKEILMAIGYVANEYGDEIADLIVDNHEEIIETMLYLIDEYGEEAAALLQVYADYLGWCPAVQDALEDMKDCAEDMKAELLQNLEDLKAELESLYDELKDAEDEIRAEIEEAIEAVEKAIAAVEEAIEAIENLIEEIEDLIAAIESGIKENIVQALEDIKTALDAVNEAIAMVEEAVSIAKEVIDVMVEVIEVAAEVVEAIEDLIEDLPEIIEEVKATAAAIDNTIDELNEKIQQAITDLQAALMNANHAVLASCSSTYAAMGGVTAAKGGYVKQVAEYIEAKSVQNCAETRGVPYDGQMAHAKSHAAEIADADLITYQMDANELVVTLIDTILSLNLPGGGYTSPDWSEYVDTEELLSTAEEVTAEVNRMQKELAAYLDEETLAWIADLEADILAKLDEYIDEDALEEVKPYVESIAYSLVEYAVGVAEAVEIIDTINPDAVVMLIGMYNPLEGATVTMNGETIDLGEYFSYIVEAADIYNLVYAVLGGDVTVVEVCEAPVLETAGNLDVDSIIALMEKMSNGMTLEDLEVIQAMVEKVEAWIRSATGNYSADQDYIAEQIKAALTVKDHIAGDAAAENAVPATCEDPGSHDDVVYCTVCGKELSRTLVTDPATGHTAGDAVKENAVPATCTEPGSYEDAVYCTVCGEELSRTLVPVEAAGHKYGAWTSLNANEHQRVCATDANHAEKASHVYDNDLDTICNDCGYERFIGGGGGGSSSGGSSKPVKQPCKGGDDCVSCCTFADLKAAIGKNSSIWWHEAIDYVIEKKLMNGVGNSMFAPDKPTTRAMIVTTLYRIEGCPAVTGDNDYTDVKDDFWYTDAIIWATENDIVNGYGNGEFGPDDVVTREQIAAIFHRYAQYKSVSPSATADLSGYTDADEISTWAVDSMKWANKIGLMEGRSTTTLVPLGDTTRAEMATLLYRWCEEIA